MSKFNRREFLKLSAIWGTVPLIPKWLSFRESVPDEEELEEETVPNPWNEDSIPSPYFLSGGTSVWSWTYTDADSVVAWYNDKEESTK